jgi:integrase
MPGKTARFGRAVYIPIHPQLWDWLCQLPRPESDSTPILSQFPKRNKWTEDDKLTYCVGLFRSLGINDTEDGKASFHSLRASFITRCDEAGVNRRATKGVAGQVADNVTDLYSHDKETAKQILSLPAPEL